MRNFKFVAVAVVGVLLMSAAFASAASAADEYQSKSTSGTTFLTSTSEANSVFKLGATVTCTKMTGKAEYPGTSTTAVLMTGNVFSGCTVSGQTATLNMNGCTLEFDQPTGVSSPFTIPTIKISCPAGATIVITATTAGCTIKIGSQTTTGTSTATNNAGPPETITVVGGVGGIVYTSSGGICGTSGTSGTFSWRSVWKAFGNAALSIAVGLAIKHF